MGKARISLGRDHPGERSKALVARDRKEQKQGELASGILGGYFSHRLVYSRMKECFCCHFFALKSHVFDQTPG